MLASCRGDLGDEDWEAKFSADSVSSLPVAPLLASFVGGTRRDHRSHSSRPAFCLFHVY